MTPTKTRNATTIFTAPKNWDPQDGECGDLEVRADTYGKSGIVQLVSTWKPTPNDLYLLERGGVVEVSLLTALQPAMAVTVVSPVLEVETEEYAEPVRVDETDLRVLTINEAAHGHE